MNAKGKRTAAQSHISATSKPPRGYPEATPRLPSGHLVANR